MKRSFGENRKKWRVATGGEKGGAKGMVWVLRTSTYEGRLTTIANDVGDIDVQRNSIVALPAIWRQRDDWRL